MRAGAISKPGLLAAACLAVLYAATPAAGGDSYFLNRIEGRIFDESRNPVGDMYVELQNDVGSTLQTVRSTALGRFTLVNLSSGVFRVRVLPSGKNFIEQTQDIQFVPSRTGRNDETQFMEFYLKADKRFASPEPSSPDAVFVQEVPDEAKRLYRSGVDSLDKKDDRGLAQIEAAIAAYPTYFDALSRLGKEYAMRKEYRNAYALLLRAIDVNQRSLSSYYFLGWSFYKLNEIPAAVKAAEACTVLSPRMIEGYVLLGTVQRIGGDLAKAEVALKKALTLSNGKDAQAHWQMALLFNRMNRNDEAADELEAYLKLAKPDDADKKAAQDLVAKLRAAKND